MERLRQRHEIDIYFDWQAILILLFLCVLAAWFVQFHATGESPAAEKLAHFTHYAEEADHFRRRVKPRDWQEDT